MAILILKFGGTILLFVLHHVSVGLIFVEQIYVVFRNRY